jgi:quercetin dioxygenase-like cupin family protein
MSLNNNNNNNNMMMMIVVVDAADEDPLQDFCVATSGGGGVNVNGRTCKPADETTAADFTSTLFRSANLKAPTAGKRAAITRANVNTFPGLNTLGLSARHGEFPPDGGHNPLHVHPRSTEVLFVVEGTLTVGFISSAPNYTLYQSTLQSGDLFVFPRGLPHFQINLDKTRRALTFAALNSQNSGHDELAVALFASNPSLPDELLVNSLGIPPSLLHLVTDSVRAVLQHP